MVMLSICIPTYNRSRCLAELLDSLAPQCGEEVEVIVSDDASPDNTQQILQDYKQKLPCLRYFRQPTNLGLDRNYHALVNAANGEYVWFMGDDDRVRPHAVTTVLAALKQWPGITGMTVGVIDYDFNLVQRVGVRLMPPTQRIETAEELFSKIPDLLGFMSALVINRDAWLQVCQKHPVQNYENLYVQVYILGRALQAAPGWLIFDVPCVDFRTSNDQFGNKLGWFKRMQVDIAAYNEIASGLFHDQPVAERRMRKDIFLSHVVSRVRNAKTSEGQTSDLLKATMFLAGKYWNLPAFWLSVLPTLLLPNRVLRLARRLYQNYSPSSGTSRARRLAD